MPPTPKRKRLTMSWSVTENELLKHYESFFTFVSEDLPRTFLKCWSESNGTFAALIKGPESLLMTEEEVRAVGVKLTTRAEAKEFLTAATLGRTSYESVLSLNQKFPVDQKMFAFQVKLLKLFEELEAKILPCLLFLDALKPSSKQKNFDYTIWAEFRDEFTSFYNFLQNDIEKIKNLQLTLYHAWYEFTTQPHYPLRERKLILKQREQVNILRYTIQKWAMHCFTLYKVAKDNGTTIHQLVTNIVDSIIDN